MATFTDADGIVFEWDEDKKAYFPSLNEDLLSKQQSIYKQEESDAIKDEPKKKEPKKKEPKNETKRKNTSIFVQGLPEDTNAEEIHNYFSKCGIIMNDFLTHQPKIKMYYDEQGRFKGEALICYFKEESVPLAIQILDETEYAPKTIIKVQAADFSKEKFVAGESAPSKKIDKRLVKKELERMEKRLQWEEQKVETKFRKIVILKHMFTPKEIESDPTLIFDLKEDILKECEKLGEVTNVKVYDMTEDGVCSVKFKEVVSADACIKIMDGRYFGGRRIEAKTCEGFVELKKLQVKETVEESEKRLESYGKWLEGEEGRESQDEDDEERDLDDYDEDKGENDIDHEEDNEYQNNQLNNHKKIRIK